MFFKLTRRIAGGTWRVPEEEHRELRLEVKYLAALTAVTDEQLAYGLLLACNYCEKTLFSFH